MEDILESAETLLKNAHKDSDGTVSYDQCQYCGLWKEALEMDFCISCENGDLFCKEVCLHRCTQCKKIFCTKCLEFEGTYSGNNGTYFPHLEKWYECPNCG